MGVSVVGNFLFSFCISEFCVISLIDFALVSVIVIFIFFSIRFSRLVIFVWFVVVSVYKKVRFSSTVSVSSVIIRTILSSLRISLFVRMVILFFIVFVIVGSVRAEESISFSWRLSWLEIIILLVLKRIVSRVFFGSRIFLIIIGLF